MKLFKNTGWALVLLGATFFFALFSKVLFQIDLLPNYSYLSSYLMSFSGAALLVWGLLMISAANQGESVALVAKMTGIMMLLFAAMRVMAFFAAEQVFPFLPSPFAQLVPVGESILFIALAAVFLTRYKS